MRPERHVLWLVVVGGVVSDGFVLPSLRNSRIRRAASGAKKRGNVVKRSKEHAHSFSRTEMVRHATEEALRKCQQLCVPSTRILKRMVKSVQFPKVAKIYHQFGRTFARYWYGKKSITGSGLSLKQSQTLERLRNQITSDMSQEAYRSGMSLDDDVLVRYLSAARWRLQFSDRPVIDALAHTIRWRSMTPAASRPQSFRPRRDLLETFHTAWRPPIFTRRGEYLLTFNCLKTPRAPIHAWSNHFVHTVESAIRHTDTVSVVVDGRGCSPRRLLDAAKAVSPAFNDLRTHYCGRLGRVYVLGSGKGPAVTWWFVKKFLDDRTRDKIVFIPDACKLMPYFHRRDHRRLLNALE